MGGFLSFIWPSGGLFWLFCGASGFIALICLAVSISSALYLVAEMAEEYPTLAGVILKRYTMPVVLGLHVVLWLDGLPTYSVCVGLLSHGAYHLALKSFPFVKVMSINSLLCVLAFIWSHWTWFSYFNQLGQQQKLGVTGAGGRVDMLHMVGFFLVLVWAVPMGIFVSMSISDNVLPGVLGSTQGVADVAVDGSKGKGKSNLFKSVYDACSAAVERIADAAYTGAAKAGVGAMKRAGSSGLPAASGGGGGYADASGGMGSFDPYAANPAHPTYAPAQFASGRGVQGQGSVSAQLPASAAPPSLNQRKRE